MQPLLGFSWIKYSMLFLANVAIYVSFPDPFSSSLLFLNIIKRLSTFFPSSPFPTLFIQTKILLNFHGTGLRFIQLIILKSTRRQRPRKAVTCLQSCFGVKLRIICLFSSLFYLCWWPRELIFMNAPGPRDITSPSWTIAMAFSQ